MKNILLLNAGTRDVLVRDFLKTIDGKCDLIVTDSYELAPTLYETSKHYVTKRWAETGYWDQIEEICRIENVGLVLSLIDPELELLAKQKERFEKLGVVVNIADEKIIKATYDKYQTLEFIREHGFAWIKSYVDYSSAKAAIDSGVLSFPVITKPRKGSGSIGIEVVHSLERLESICREHNDVLIQEFISGQEIGADIYVDLITGEAVSIFTKKKLKMRAGETDKSVSFKEQKLFNLLASFAKEFGLRGTNDIDVFEKDGEYYISEVNPRFGGGYIHAYAAGVDFPALLINNMLGQKNFSNIGSYDSGVYMMKYFDIKVCREDNLL